MTMPQVLRRMNSKETHRNSYSDCRFVDLWKLAVGMQETLIFILCHLLGVWCVVPGVRQSAVPARISN